MEGLGSINPQDPDVLKLGDAFAKFSADNDDLPMNQRIILFSEFMKTDPELSDLSKRVFSKMDPKNFSKDKVENAIKSLGVESPLKFNKNEAVYEPKTVSKNTDTNTNIDVKSRFDKFEKEKIKADDDESVPMDIDEEGPVPMDTSDDGPRVDNPPKRKREG